jgi:hypothetical protein
MLAAQARVPTARARRYLVQFCRHASQMTQQPSSRSTAAGRVDAPPEVRGAAWSDTLGVVRFGSGCCLLQASPDTLLVSIDATGEDELQRPPDLPRRRVGEGLPAWQPAGRCLALPARLSASTADARRLISVERIPHSPLTRVRESRNWPYVGDSGEDRRMRDNRVGSCGSLSALVSGWPWLPAWGTSLGVA